jgi:hypothetical protein
MNSLIEVTQTVSFTPARLLAQVEYSTLKLGPAPLPGDYRTTILLQLLDRSFVEDFHKTSQPG